MEFAGAFGDLGTLIPFVVGYITLNKMDPLGILVAFGVFKIFVGLYFKTPVPIQPMKAIGGMAIAHSGSITPGMILGSGIFTGLFWLLMGATGAITWIEKITTKPVVRGIMLGLGLSFIMEGLGMMKVQPLFAIGGVVITLFLLNSKRFPAMLCLLAYGITVAFIQKPELIGELSNLSIRFRLPELAFGQISWKELLSGFFILGLPQAPLTLGNAIIGTVAENNQYFPDRKVTAKTISLDHGVMNLISTCIGGVPMCHGAGGMAGHIRFGARTGGALVILGLIVLLTGLFLSDSVALLFQVFPRPILGVILFFAGVELALVIRDIKLKKQNLFVLLVTAGTAMWNMGVAYLAGLLLYYGLQRRWFRI
ncbi:MAG: sulfate transporter [Deltaproteobacteria bacterium CG_4_8_14_3_um_filter_45_9]|nr:MAG: sulfate transporter [Deltaproteobacteria bacterium CG03_land_8_20_14_0_80_45_14]PIX23478.1 MAG: sulfate transporter [Deltaproteobacteria bacterium CG_4_8_14_3_um_filter_45_9]